MLPKFKFPTPLFPLFPFTTKNPLKTLHYFPPKMSSSSSSSPWTCQKCTFLNPPSQKHTCQICLTPPLTTTPPPPSSSSLPTWACKACTFLNSYTRSNCDICDTRNSNNYHITNDFADDNDPAASTVGSVFFPLRRCGLAPVVEDKVFAEMGSHQFDKNGGNFGGSGSDLGSGNKRKFQDLGKAEDATIIKQESFGATKGSGSAKIADNKDGGTKGKRKMRDLGDFVEKANVFDGFRDTKSSNKEVFLGKTDKVGVVETEKASVSQEIVEDSEFENVSSAIKILSYNVWFREDLEVHERMQGIGNLIQLHSPDVICFQEVTPDIYGILQRSTWWKNYRCSLSYEMAACEGPYFCMQLAKLPVKSFSTERFSYTAMGRKLHIAQVEVLDKKSVVVATSHLESPCPGPPKWDQMYSKERVNQAREAISYLQQHPNVIFCGDMNWDDKLDGRFPFTEGWFDAWEKVRPGEVGYTYDTKTNKMLTGNRTLQKRLDRFICHLPDFEICSMDMIGTEAIPGLTYTKDKKVRGEIKKLELPVLPSDHYGLLLTITSK